MQYALFVRAKIRAILCGLSLVRAKIRAILCGLSLIRAIFLYYDGKIYA